MKRLAILAAVLVAGCTQEPLSPKAKAWVDRCVAANGSMDIARTECRYQYDRLVRQRVLERTMEQ